MGQDARQSTVDLPWSPDYVPDDMTEFFVRSPYRAVQEHGRGPAMLRLRAPNCQGWLRFSYSPRLPLPPSYCNCYDYKRKYALDLALSGRDE